MYELSDCKDLENLKLKFSTISSCVGGVEKRLSSSTTRRPKRNQFAERICSTRPVIVPYIFNEALRKLCKTKSLPFIAVYRRMLYSDHVKFDYPVAFTPFNRL
jgi:hypothetical protein